MSHPINRRKRIESKKKEYTMRISFGNFLGTPMLTFTLYSSGLRSGCDAIEIILLSFINFIIMGAAGNIVATRIDKVKDEAIIKTKQTISIHVLLAMVITYTLLYPILLREPFSAVLIDWFVIQSFIIGACIWFFDFNYSE